MWPYMWPIYACKDKKKVSFTISLLDLVLMQMQNYTVFLGEYGKFVKGKNDKGWNEHAVASSEHS